MVDSGVLCFFPYSCQSVEPKSTDLKGELCKVSVGGKLRDGIAWFCYIVLCQNLPCLIVHFVKVAGFYIYGERQTPAGLGTWSSFVCVSPFVDKMLSWEKKILCCVHRCDKTLSHCEPYSYLGCCLLALISHFATGALVFLVGLLL